MHIPMEIKTSLTSRTDRSIQGQMKSGSDDYSANFTKTFEKEFAKQESRTTVENTNKQENKDEKLIEIIPLVEGYSQSAFSSDIIVGNTVEPQVNLMLNMEIEGTETLQNPENLQSAQNAYNHISQPQPINPQLFTTESEYTQAAMSTEEKTASKPEVNSLENIVRADDETVARVPEIRTHETQKSNEEFSRFSENGNLSSLENSNDKANKAEQVEKAYSQDTEAVKATANSTEIIISDTQLPVSESVKVEQFQSTQQMAQSSLSAPVRAENLLQEMISRVEMVQNDAKSTMTIQLNPDKLGKVALEVTVDTLGLHVKINAEDNVVRGIINSQLSTLIESLENKGIEVVEVEVAYTGIDNGAFKEHEENNQSQARQYNSTNGESISNDEVAYFAPLPELIDYYLDTGVSSVEYNA